MAAEVISLNGSWVLTGKPSAPGAEPAVFNTGAVQVDAVVPGNIELDLCRAGLTPEPFFGRNSNAYRKYECYEWCCEREFDVADTEGVFQLDFSGIDCLGTVFLNGIRLGSSCNALIPAVFNPGSALKKGKNTIVVHLASPVAAFYDEPLVPFSYNISYFGMEQIRVRRPAHVWGWDIAPRLALGGIFRDVVLRKLPPVRIVDWSADTCFCNPQEAMVRFHVKFFTEDASFSGLTVAVDGVCGDSVFHAEQEPWSYQQVFSVNIPAPKLWWPKHYGEQNLYKVTISIRDSRGTVLDSREFLYGIRSIRLYIADAVTHSLEPDFQFYVNDLPVRVFGLNHVPCDALHSRDMERMPEVLKLADEANLNILRIWGGGIPEDDYFYDFCDKAGILIWHDFMYACAIYPNDDKFLQEAEKEAIEILRTRRHHACIALWAGDNECDQMPILWKYSNYDPEQNRLTREVLPRVCQSYAPTTPYLPSSPYISPKALQMARDIKAKEPVFFAPEQHLWGSHEYFKSDFYRTNASFVSESGYHACPNVSALKKFLPEDKLWPWDNDDWFHHASNPFKPNTEYDYRIRLLPDQIMEYFGEPAKDLESFALASQICQAEANKYFLERARSTRKMTGMTIWNLIDCWPHFSDSIVDYYYGKKLSYYYCQRHFAPFLIMVSEAADWHREVTLCNDSQEFRKGHVVVRKWKGEVLFETDFTAKPGEITTLGRFKCLAMEQGLLLIEWTFEDGTKGGNHQIAGSPHFDFATFRDEWLPAIAAVDGSFDPAEVGK